MLTATATEASSKEPRKPHCEPPIFSVLRSAPGPGSPDLAAEARQRSPSGTLTVSAATSDPLQGRPPTRGGRLAACRLEQAVHVRPSPARSGPCGKQLAVAGFDDDGAPRVVEHRDVERGGVMPEERNLEHPLRRIVASEPVHADKFLNPRHGAQGYQLAPTQ